MTAVETQEVVCPEVFSSTHDVRESTSLLGLSGRGMRLRVSRDKPRTSDIVELASRRCLVGSAPRCHVRINEPGVAPIECLILQGAKSNVVRWLDASREFAGGELFEDEVLLAGDPLQIGPVELELLVDEIISAEEPHAAEEMPEIGEDRLGEYVLRLERLEVQLVELQQASELTSSLTDAPTNSDLKDEVAATISDLSAQLAVLQSRSATDRELWAGQRAELEALLESRLQEFDFLRDEVQRLRDELASVRSEFGNGSAHEQADERLVEVTQQLAERTAEFEQQRTNWERDQNEFQRQLQQSIERLEQFETQLAQQGERQAESDAARQAAEARADRLQESVEELSKRLAEQQQDHETVRAAWQADRASLESELTETKQRLALSADAESGGLELRETWDRGRAELKSQVDEATSPTDAIQEELDLPRRQFDDRHQSRCESLPDDQVMDQPKDAGGQHLDRKISAAPLNPMERLLAGSSSVDDRRDESADPLQDFLAFKPTIYSDAESENPDDTYSDSGYGPAAGVASSYYEQAFSSLQSAEYLDVATADDETVFESADSKIDEGEDVAFEIASAAPPVSTADVLARLGQVGVWSDDGIVADGSADAPSDAAGDSPNDVFAGFAEPETEEPASEQPAYRPFNETPFAAPTSDATSGSDDDEESIEAYMARLMNRVRGAGERDEPASLVQPNVERSPVTEYTEVPKTPQPELEPEAEKFGPDVYKPRSQAPELADRMTAMRSLANDSARTAIASHAKRNWSSIMKLKLFVSVFAFVAVLVSVIFFWGDPLLMVLGSLVGVGVMAYWARMAMTYRIMFLDSLMLDVDGDDDALTGDDAASTERA